MKSPKSPNNRSTSSKKNKPGKPTRPYTEYNIFFQLEREYILQVLLGVVAEPEEIFDPFDSSGKANNGNGGGGCSGEYEGTQFEYRGPSLPSRYASLILPNDWYVPGKERRRKRRHRKSHGKIGFHELSLKIADAWKEITTGPDRENNLEYAEVRAFCAALSDIAMLQYKNAMRNYKRQEQQQQAASDDAGRRLSDNVEATSTLMISWTTGGILNESLSSGNNNKKKPTLMNSWMNSSMNDSTPSLLTASTTTTTSRNNENNSWMNESYNSIVTASSSSYNSNNENNSWMNDSNASIFTASSSSSSGASSSNMTTTFSPSAGDVKTDHDFAMMESIEFDDFCKEVGASSGFDAEFDQEVATFEKGGDVHEASAAEVDLYLSFFGETDGNSQSSEEITTQVYHRNSKQVGTTTHRTSSDNTNDDLFKSFVDMEDDEILGMWRAASNVAPVARPHIDDVNNAIVVPNNRMNDNHHFANFQQHRVINEVVHQDQNNEGRATSASFDFKNPVSEFQELESKMESMRFMLSSQQEQLKRVSRRSFVASSA